MKNKSIRQGRFDARDKAAQLFCWCLVVAMNQEEGIGASRLEKACNKMEAFQARGIKEPCSSEAERRPRMQ